MGTLIRDNLSLERIDEISGNTSLKEVKSVIHTIKNELSKNRDLTCLAAPQIGKNLRLFVVKTNNKTFKEFLNPMVVKRSKEQHLSRERNMSISDSDWIIPRSNEIHVAYQTYDGHIQSETYKGPYAEVVQQMIELLDGISIADYGLEVIKEFDEASDEDKTKVLQMYLDSLKNRSKNLQQQITADPELKNLNDIIDFNIGLLNGTIKPIDKDGNVVEYEVNEEKGIVPKVIKDDSQL